MKKQIETSLSKLCKKYAHLEPVNRPKKYRSMFWTRRPLNWGTHPQHQVSRQTIVQLKMVLKGKRRIEAKYPFNKSYRKKLKKNFEHAAVIWNNEANGLGFLNSIYNAQPKFPAGGIIEQSGTEYIGIDIARPGYDRNSVILYGTCEGPGKPIEYHERIEALNKLGFQGASNKTFIDHFNLIGQSIGNSKDQQKIDDLAAQLNKVSRSAAAAGEKMRELAITCKKSGQDIQEVIAAEIRKQKSDGKL